jgi:heat-inducible transcriptional repressor
MLTPRQEFILSKVVEAFLDGGQPVPSRTIAALPDIDCGPSTVRHELALLEEEGLLAHPHTSAGRVPTDAGHRYVVDRMLASGEGLVPARRIELSLIRHEVDEAMQVTTEALSQVTNLLAVVSAPSLATATIRHVEVLALQPKVVMAVVITSTGSVSRVVASFDDPVDPGLVTWGGAYLNERLVGLGLGARMLGQRLADPGLGARERAFIERLRPAFSELAQETEDTIYVEGTARLFSDQSLRDRDEIRQIMDVLEHRVSLLAVLRSALYEPGMYVRIGSENSLPALRSLALVASGYGLAARRLGTVSVIGPVHMDYARAIAGVREAARELSRFVEHAFAES